MRWSERQRAMLQAMGVRLFERMPGEGEPAEREAGTSVVATPATATPATAATRSPPVPAAPARALAARADSAVLATLDWAPLRDAVQACRACALGDSRRQAVFGVGHPRAHWMIVGEAPGEQEDLRGEPFVGDSGQLLDQMLRALGLTRGEAPPERQVFIANTLKCRPPHNRNPLPEETAQCRPFLERQITLVQPRIVLAMGRFAAQALLGSDEPLGKLRGQVHQYLGLPLVVTYHPAYLLRTPADKARAWADLCLAATVVQGGGRA